MSRPSTKFESSKRRVFFNITLKEEKRVEIFIANSMRNKLKRHLLIFRLDVRE